MNHRHKSYQIMFIVILLSVLAANQEPKHYHVQANEEVHVSDSASVVTGMVEQVSGDLFVVGARDKSYKYKIEPDTEIRTSKGQVASRADIRNASMVRVFASKPGPVGSNEIRSVSRLVLLQIACSPSICSRKACHQKCGAKPCNCPTK